MSVPSSLSPGESLSNGEYLLSPDGRYQFIFQDDGNLVLYPYEGGVTGQFIWASNTANQGGTQAIMQTDGNFVIYAGSNPLWSTGTDNGQLYANFSNLYVQNDGNVVIYYPTSSWATNTTPSAGLPTTLTLTWTAQ